MGYFYWCTSVKIDAKYIRYYNLPFLADTYLYLNIQLKTLSHTVFAILFPLSCSEEINQAG